MVTALLGHIGPFDPAEEEWPQYVERLEQFLEANDVTGEDKASKQRATFLAVIGRSAYNSLRSLLAPAKRTEKTFDKLVQVLSAHYSPPPTEVMQRFRFNSRACKDGESVADYVAELRKLAEGCNYRDSLNKMLQERLMWGVKDTSIQKKLLAEPMLTLDKAIQLAQSTETAEKNLREMEGDSSRETVHQVRRSSRRTRRATSNNSGTDRGTDTPDNGNCFRCGKPDHRSRNCPFKDRVCHKCQNRGHLARMCCSNPNPKRRSGRGGRRRQVQYFKEEEEEEEEESKLEDSDSNSLLLQNNMVTEVGEVNKLYRPQ